MIQNYGSTEADRPERHARKLFSQQFIATVGTSIDRSHLKIPVQLSIEVGERLDQARQIFFITIDRDDQREHGYPFHSLTA